MAKQRESNKIRKKESQLLRQPAESNFGLAGGIVNAEARAEYIVNSLRNSIPLIAEEIRTAQREATERCFRIEFPILRADMPDYEQGWNDCYKVFREKIRVLIEQLEEAR